MRSGASWSQGYSSRFPAAAWAAAWMASSEGMVAVRACRMGFPSARQATRMPKQSLARLKTAMRTFVACLAVVADLQDRSCILS